MYKKIIIILLSFFIISNVYAKDTCNQDSISIDSIELKELSDNTKEDNKASIENKKINLDLKMYEVGDYAEYKLTVKNNSNDDFYFDENSININSDYFDYKFKYTDNTNKIKANSEKTIYLRVEYKKEIEKEKYWNGSYINEKVVNIPLSDNKFINPLTKNNYFIVLFFLVIVIIGVIQLRKKQFNSIIILLGLLLIPLSTYAECKCSLDLNPKITVIKVKPNPCTYDGELVQGATYVNGQYTYKYRQHGWGLNLEEDGWGVILTDKDSTDAVTTKLCSSINEKPIVSMASMFSSSKAESIDLSSFDTSNVTNMYGMFIGDQTTTFGELDFSSFNTSKVRNMSYLFEYSTVTRDIDLSTFDTSNVISIVGMFMHSKVVNVNMNNLDFQNLEDMNYAFEYMEANRINLTDIQVRNIISMDYLFYNSKVNSSVDLSSFTDTKIKKTDLMFFGYEGPEVILNGMDFSSVENIFRMFAEAKINKIDLRNIDTSKITDWHESFYKCESDEVLFPDNFTTGGNANLSSMFLYSKIPKIDLHGLDTSKVINMRDLFDGTTASEIILSDKFTLDSIENMYSIFDNTKGKTLDLTSFDITKIPENIFILWNAEYEKIYVKSESDAEWYRNYVGRGLKKGEFVVK